MQTQTNTAGKAGDRVEITSAMVDAGVQAYHENTSEDWSNPGGAELRAMMRSIFLAMSSGDCMR